VIAVPHAFADILQREGDGGTAKSGDEGEEEAVGSDAVEPQRWPSPAHGGATVRIPKDHLEAHRIMMYRNENHASVEGR